MAALPRARAKSDNLSEMSRDAAVVLIRFSPVLTDGGLPPESAFHVSGLYRDSGAQTRKSRPLSALHADFDGGFSRFIRPLPKTPGKGLIRQRADRENPAARPQGRNAAGGMAERSIDDWFMQDVLPLEPMLTRFLQRNWRNEAEISDLRAVKALDRHRA